VPTPRFLPFFIGEAISVLVTAPTSGATITDASPTVTWSFSPGVQQAYRVRVWSDATQGTLVYDSGSISSASGNHTIPDGSLLSGENYWLQVDIETSEADLGTSDLVAFSTLFTPSVAVTGVAVVTENDDCLADGSAKQLALPFVRIDWTEVSPAVDETFQRYSVWRRERLHPSHPRAGTEAWERIASITTVSTTTYRDYCAAAWTVYEYAVTWTAITDAGDTRTSARQTAPAHARLRFERIVLHDVENPSLFVLLSGEPSVEESQPTEFHNVWGREDPTAQVSDFKRGVVEFELDPEVFRRSALWENLKGMQAAQAQAHSLCLRLGYAGERYFASIESTISRRDIGGRAFAPRISLRRTYHEEVVA
jgi:hypothetical protein